MRRSFADRRGSLADMRKKLADRRGSLTDKRRRFTDRRRRLAGMRRSFADRREKFADMKESHLVSCPFRFTAFLGAACVKRVMHHGDLKGVYTLCQ
ncbi:MAG: hypothetical protein LBC51_01680 [Treponema sp.]|jgi:hypothetical protein|nr:hypothetical protein [Treponema sp.]